MSNRLVAAVAAGLIAVPAAAQSPPAEDLEQRIRVLERKLELVEEEKQAEAREAGAASASEKGFGLKSADGSFELKFKGLLQADTRFYIDDARAFNDTFLLRRMEPAFELTLGKLAFFKFLPQFAGDAAVIADAFGELRFHPAATLRFGKFKEPLVLENLQSSGALTFVERGLPTELGAARDYGLQLQGEVLGGAASYAVGGFNGAPDGRDAASSDVDDKKELAARLFFEPFKAQPGFLQNLGFGIAGSSGRKLGAPSAASFNATLPRYRSPGQQTVFTYTLAPTGPSLANTVVAAGDHTRLAPQLYFYRHAFGLLGEYVASKQRVSLAGAAAELEHTAWQAVASYVLTGEDASYKGVKPASAYAAGGGGWGALELALRHGVLDVDDAAFPVYADPATQVSEMADTGLALNWYLTSHARIALNYDVTKFDGGAGAGDRRDEKALFARLQLTY
jgi:phosphate-selective porin OprO/OprP